MNDRQEVVMFPGWKRDLEEQSKRAIENKNYEEALLFIHKLESFNAASNEILIAKIISLSELGQNEQAIGLCRKLMKEDESNYYQYIHIYLNILFHSNQYSEVMDTLHQLENDPKLPPEYKAHFQLLYDQCEEFLTTTGAEEREKDMDHFIDSLENGHFKEQWKLLSYHRTFAVRPYLELIKPYFVDTKLNPVIKTGLLQWCMDEEVNENLEIEKFEKYMIANPTLIEDILDTNFATKVLSELEEIEQEDPTMFSFTKQILYRYLYILFPFTPKLEQATDVANAVLGLAKQYLTLDEPSSKQHETTKDQEEWMETIERYEKVYFSQIDD